VREGRDATIVTCGQLVGLAASAADRLATEGIACDVLDLRTTSPLDEEAILDSVEASGRLIVADENPPRCGLAADIAALVASKAFSSLRAPIELVTLPHTPVPFARELESAFLPTASTIETAVRKALAYR
jgi:pyruvate/2-oxoglutarate/acetoin dehydrogenase E1 component